MISGVDVKVEVSLGDEQQAKVDYTEATIDDAFRILQSCEKGLSNEEVKIRLNLFGPNKLPEKEDNPMLEFLKFLWNPLSWCMEIAALISIILLDYLDFALIIVLLFLNATIAYHEEAAAGDAIAALTASLAPKAKALRDGVVKSVDASTLVPGDVVLVRLGDIVAADIKFICDVDHDPLQVDQAALTGESLPVKRFRGQCAFSGSTIKQGESFAVVYSTGANTFFGKAASLINETESDGHLQIIMTRIGFVCIITIILWVIIELSVQFIYYNHDCSLGAGGSCPTLSNMLVLIVGGIPIAMPTVLSVTLALGAYKLAKKGAIVSRLTAIEELAGMDMLCSDKTGTLTLNELSIDTDNLLPNAGFDNNDILLYAALGAKIENKEPIDLCCYDAYGKKKYSLWDEYVCIKYVPFNPNDKRTIATIREQATRRTFRVSKGAPQVILQMANNYEEIKSTFDERILQYARRGYRALGVGYSEKENSDNWEFVGLLPIFDPPRHDTKATVTTCMELGIGVKMITGDQLPIGIETARQLGMGTNIYTTEVFSQERSGLIQGVAIDELVEAADGFAEVFPEHKYDIVKRLQKRGHITGMTGDGVNDAPALKKGDIGIAVANATDAARAAADIVLTKPGLGIIVEAIIGARKIFQRMKSYAKYTIAMTFRICFTFGLFTVLYDWYFPTVLIVLLAIFNDGAMISLSKDRVSPSRNPDAWFLRSIFIYGLVYGLYLTLSSWALFYLASHTDFFTGGSALNMQSLKYVGSSTHCQNLGLPVDDYNQCVAEVTWERQSRLRALVYVYVSISGMALIFVTRTSKLSWFDRPGMLPMIAFVGSQIVSSLIAGFGFNGYRQPNQSVACTYCEDFSGQAPIYGTESVYNASLLGCGAWVLVAWVWATIWYIPLDLIKFIMGFLLEGDLPSLYTLGIRTRVMSQTPNERIVSSLSHRTSVTSGCPRRSYVVRGSIM
eukprot:CFRG6885T1